MRSAGEDIDSSNTRNSSQLSHFVTVTTSLQALSAMKSYAFGLFRKNVAAGGSPFSMDKRNETL